MSDLISREETIRAIDSLGEDYISYYKLLMLIGRLPSAEPEQKWIPVSEALPEEHKNVLVTTIDGERRVSHLTDINYWWNIGRCKVIAWMPLPEPYRAEGKC